MTLLDDVARAIGEVPLDETVLYCCCEGCKLKRDEIARAAIAVFAKWLHEANERGDGDMDFALFELDREMK